MGTLYLVGTPIGNLEDISLRALRVLREATLIAAEDTRATRRLLSRYGISTPLTSYFEHNKLAKIEDVLAATAVGDVALVSEAGMPGISDPGYELVRAAVARGIPVVPVPGPSAAIAALAVSGLPTDQFVFLGFLPRRSGERRRLLAEVEGDRRTLVMYEAPHRLVAALADLAAVLGNREMAAARELTKLHEELVRGTISTVRDHFLATAPRGEFTLVVAGQGKQAPPTDSEEARRRLRAAVERGLTGKEAVAAAVAETGLPRREVYRLWVEMERGRLAGGR